MFPVSINSEHTKDAQVITVRMPLDIRWELIGPHPRVIINQVSLPVEIVNEHFLKIASMLIYRPNHGLPLGGEKDASCD